MIYTLKNWLDEYYPYNRDRIFELNCSHQNINSLEGIELLKNLKLLNCKGNSITSLKPLKNNNNLITLFCSFNDLTTLEGIENLNLKELDYVGNKIKDYREIGIITLTEIKIDILKDIRKRKINKLIK